VTRNPCSRSRLSQTGEQRWVLGLLGDDVVTAITSRQRGAAHREGVALGASAGEDDLVGRRSG
jgi:hypothetical protein